jgi:hypothetical protein
MEQQRKKWEDPIVAEVRSKREAYARQFNYDLNLLVEDLQRKRTVWEKMGMHFVDPSSEAIPRRKSLKPNIDQKSLEKVKTEDADDEHQS